MAQTSFEIDAKTAAALEALKEVYGVSTNAAVLKRALAIAVVASRFADEDENRTIRLIKREPDGDKEVLLPQHF